MKIPIYYSGSYLMDFNDVVSSMKSASHLQPQKNKRFYEALSGNAPEKVVFRAPHEATKDELKLVHTDEYLASLGDYRNVLAIFEVEPREPKAENRYVSYFIDKNILKPIRIITGGTIEAVESLREHQFAINLGGGLHHAGASKGEGFCPYNDVAIAIKKIMANDPSRRALVVDLDAHQGNGTAEIFSTEKNVFTFSMHQANIYPAHKPHSSLDIELDDKTEGNNYMRLLSQHLPNILDMFRPDYVVYLAGADVHEADPLTGLMLTTEQIIERDAYVAKMLIARKIPCALLTSGGYSEKSIDAQRKSLQNLIEVYSH